MPRSTGPHAGFCRCPAAASINNTDGSAGYLPPSRPERNLALADVDAPLLQGPLKGDAQSIRAAMKQNDGKNSKTRTDIAEAMLAQPFRARPSRDACCVARRNRE